MACTGSVKFQLTVQSNVGPDLIPQTFTVETFHATLLQALTEFGKGNSQFCFEARDSGRGQYVVSVTVNGVNVRNGDNTFWETLYYDSGEVQPVALGTYHPHGGDHVYLNFSKLSTGDFTA